jgi:hypothetical protein
MAKTTLEPVWSTQTVGETVIGWFHGINHWVHNSMQAMRPLVNASSGNRHAGKNTSLLSAFIQQHETKVNEAEHKLKGSFFQLSGFKGQSKVPDRVWKRHSALLVYREQVNRQQLHK